MDTQNQPFHQKVIISSANPLFAQGLEKILLRKHQEGQIEILHVKNMEETVLGLEQWEPDVVVVDYDDHTINRSEFLHYFVRGELPMRVMLVSLRASGVVVVYNRQTLSTDQAEDWLSLSNGG
jgi:cytochrome c oxidase subunit 2